MDCKLRHRGSIVLEAEQSRLDTSSALYSRRNGEKYLSYRQLRNRPGHVDDPHLLSELLSMSHLHLIEIQNGLTRFLEGSDLLGMMSITTEGEAYFRQSFQKKRILLLAEA